jgi:CheY-like chemotaxis protein
MAGYEVLEAADLAEVVSKLEQQTVNVVLAELDLPPSGSSALLAALRRRPEWEKIPVLALADSADPVQAAAARAAGFEDCLAKFDRVLVLESVAKLVSPLASFALVAAGAGVER